MRRRRRVFSLYRTGQHQEALSVVRNAPGEYPDEDNDLTFWEACFLARLERPEEALTVLAKGLDRGLWWAPGTLADADLDPVRPLAGWEEVANRCSEITEAKLANRPSPVVRKAVTPEGTIVAIQGAQADHEAVAATWAATAPDTWTVITPAGAEPVASGWWAWPRSVEGSASSVIKDLEDLAPARPLVLTGFSIGSAIACHLISIEALPVDGLIAVAPSSVSDFDDLRTVARTGMPTLVICGDQDPRYAKYMEFEGEIGGRPNVTIDLIVGLGHSNPPDLDRRISGLLTTLGRSSVV